MPDRIPKGMERGTSGDAPPDFNNLVDCRETNNGTKWYRDKTTDLVWSRYFRDKAEARKEKALAADKEAKITRASESLALFSKDDEEHEEVSPWPQLHSALTNTMFDVSQAAPAGLCVRFVSWHTSAFVACQLLPGGRDKLPVYLQQVVDKLQRCISNGTPIAFMQLPAEMLWYIRNNLKNTEVRLSPPEGVKKYATGDSRTEVGGGRRASRRRG